MVCRFWIIFIVLVFTGCGQQSTPEQAQQESTSPIVAKVGATSVHESDIDAEMERLPEPLQHLKSDQEARNRVLHSLINRQVLGQKALELGIDTNPEIHQRIERTRNSILIQALEELQMSRFPQPSDKEIETYYRLHANEFSMPEQIHAQHILLPTEKQARDVLAKLKQANADFASLAAQYSIDDSNKSRGGDLNWFSRGTMVKPFEQAAFSLKNPGDLAGPIKTQFGWHIIQLLDKRAASMKSLDDAREEIINQLRQKQLDAWIDQTVSESSVKIVDPAYKDSQGLEIKNN